MSIDTQYPYRPADARGWGSGWPSCQTEKWVTAPPPIVGQVHERIVELVGMLMAETERRGYAFKSGQCWGASCRPIKNSDGTLSEVPSNHSWALAVDLNSLENGYGVDDFKMPRWVGALWNTYGFGWGGDYPNVKDAMHMEFVGTPEQADEMTVKARDELGGDAWMALFDNKGEFEAAVRSALTGTSDDKDGLGTGQYRQAYEVLRGVYNVYNDGSNDPLAAGKRFAEDVKRAAGRT